MSKWKIVLVLAAVASFGVTLASADTLQLQSAPYGQAGPYLFSVNGSSTLTPLICYSEKNLITYGEQWTVQEFTISTVGSITGDFAGSITQYNELGYLANELFASPGNTDIQNAIWAVLNTGGAQNSYYLGAVNFVTNNPGYQTSDVFYIPVGDFSKLPYGEPQPFIGRATVPEPASLLLLGAGLLGLVGTTRKKKLLG